MSARASSRKAKATPMQKLKPFLNKHKLVLISAIALSVIATFLGLVPYWIVYMVGVTLFSDGGSDGSYLLTLAFIALLAIVGKGVCTGWSINMTHKAAYEVIYEVRIALAEKLAKLPLGFFDQNDSGKIKHTMSEDVEQLEEGIAHLLPDIATSAALPVLTFIMMFMMDWRMALAVVAFVLLMLVGYILANMYLKPIMPGYGKANAGISSAIMTYVHGMKVIKAFSRSEQAFTDYSKAVKEYADISTEIETKAQPAKAIAMLLSQTSMIIVIPFGLWLLQKQEISLAVFVFFILMSMGVGAALFKVFRSSGMTAFRLAGAIKGITRILEEKEIAFAAQSKAKPTSTKLDISFENVSFSYEQHEVLSNVSFTIAAGSMTALVGQSGAGKTTIGRLLPRFWDIDSGVISIGGVDIREMSETSLMELISYVSQDSFLFEGTIMDNIRIGKPTASDEEVIAAARKAQCHEFILSLPQGYVTMVGEEGGKLSGGQRQRISLVRAILKDAPILVLDEATAWIDPENEVKIQEALSELLKPHQGHAPKTIITIAHRLGTVVHADQIIVMEEGEVAERGTHQQLLELGGLYATLWQAYAGGMEQLSNEAQSEQHARSGQSEAGADGAALGKESNHTLADQSVADQSRTDKTAGERAFVAASTVARQTHTEAVQRSADASSGSLQGSGQQQGQQGQRSGQEQDDPYQCLEQLSALEQTQLLAGDKQQTTKTVLIYSIFEYLFIALGSISIVWVLYASIMQQFETAWLAVCVMLALFIGQATAYYLGAKLYFPIYGQLSVPIRLYLGDRLRKLPFGYFMVKDASVLESRIKTDASMYTFIPYIVIMITKGIVIPSVIFAAMLWLDWRLALIAMLGVPLTLFATWVTDNRFKLLMGELNEARQQANGRIFEYIRGISVIRAFNLAGERMTSYSNVLARFRDASINLHKRLAAPTALYNVSFELGFVFVMLAGVQFLAGDSLKGSIFMILLVLAICFYDPLPLMDYTVYRRMQHTLIRHMNDIIQAEPLPVMPSNGSNKPADASIELRNVTFAYSQDGKAVLDNLSLVIPERGITALVGSSGGGKTTILNLIARFWDVQQGQVLLGGVDVKQMESDELMKYLSFVFQDVYLFNGTIASNIAYGKPEATQEEIEQAAKAARCHEFILKLPQGYDTMVGEGGGMLSGGQKQRISIARALLKDAPVILLDEATASVDPDNEQYIQEVVAELAQRKTIIMIAHRLHTIIQAQQIVVLDSGKIIEQGTHQQLMAQAGKYQHFWNERLRAQQWKVSRS